jgi:hypothetical protein
MDPQIVASLIQGWSTFLGALIGGGAVILTQHMTAKREREARRDEMEHRSKQLQVQHQAKTMRRLQKLGIQLVKVFQVPRFFQRSPIDLNRLHVLRSFP